MLRGVSNRPVKIFCAYFGHIYIFYDVLLRFFHVRCLNILKFGNSVGSDEVNGVGLKRGKMVTTT